MNKFVAALVAETFSDYIAPHIETIPIQTLTISDEQFLKGDASGRLLFDARFNAVWAGATNVLGSRARRACSCFKASFISVSRL
jgi:hypothetical protein